jgi:hypothetical protein
VCTHEVPQVLYSFQYQFLVPQFVDAQVIKIVRTKIKKLLTVNFII